MIKSSITKSKAVRKLLLMKPENKRNLVRGEKFKGKITEGEVFLFLFRTVHNPINGTHCYRMFWKLKV